MFVHGVMEEKRKYIQTNSGGIQRRKEDYPERERWLHERRTNIYSLQDLQVIYNTGARDVWHLLHQSMRARSEWSLYPLDPDKQ